MISNRTRQRGEQEITAGTGGDYYFNFFQGSFFLPPFFIP